MSANKDKGPENSKYWHFRVNDLSQEQYDKLVKLDCDYIIIGELEDNKVRSGKHYHAIIQFKRSVRPAKAKSLILYNDKLHTADWYLGTKYHNSTSEQFIYYSIKTGIRYERGKYSQQAYHKEHEADKKLIAQSNDPNLALKNYTEAKNRLRFEKGAQGDLDWFAEHDCKYMLTAEFNRLLVWAQPDAKKNLEELDNIMIVGKPNCGKSSAVDFIYPNCYRKIKNNEKWDNYFNLNPDHQVVYFDELDDIESLEQCCGGLEGLKTILDVYPFAVRQNYGNRQLMIRPKKIIITSNFSLSEILSTPNKYGRITSHLEMKLKALKRRFKCYTIEEFHKLHNIYFDPVAKRTFRLDEVKPAVLPLVKPPRVRVDIFADSDSDDSD